MIKLFAKIIFSVMLSLSMYTVGQASENAFYILRINPATPTKFSQAAWSSLTSHVTAINILIPQAYQIDASGNVTGAVSPIILDFAQQHAMKVMPLITNVGFDPDKIHQFLSNPGAQTKALRSLLTLYQSSHYYGVQFDFEGVTVKDKIALTNFYLQAAKALHQKKMLMSIAVIPLVSANPQPSDFLKRKYENWAGVYDLKAFNRYADFISLMAYDQHSPGTTPGPSAGLPWVEATIRYTLKFISPQKLSLGIPTYSGHWRMGSYMANHIQHLFMQESDLGYSAVLNLIDQHHAKLKWDTQEKIHYAIYENNWLNEFLFIEDAKSFAAKLQLAKKYHLRGISVFDLGNEDPQMWQIIQS